MACLSHFSYCTKPKAPGMNGGAEVTARNSAEKLVLDSAAEGSDLINYPQAPCGRSWTHWQQNNWETIVSPRQH